MWSMRGLRRVEHTAGVRRADGSSYDGRSPSIVSVAWRGFAGEDFAQPPQGGVGDFEGSSGRTRSETPASATNETIQNCQSPMGIDAEASAAAAIDSVGGAIMRNRPIAIRGRR